MDTLIFEVGTALVLVAIAAVIAGKFKFSVIPFLIVLGMLVGPHAPTIGVIDFKFIESASCHFPSLDGFGVSVSSVLSRTRVFDEKTN